MSEELKERSCPNGTKWCEGPDRYAGICNACLATWTEEAKAAPPVESRSVIRRKALQRGEEPPV